MFLTLKTVSMSFITYIHIRPFQPAICPCPPSHLHGAEICSFSQVFVTWKFHGLMGSPAANGGPPCHLASMVDIENGRWTNRYAAVQLSTVSPQRILHAGNLPVWVCFLSSNRSCEELQSSTTVKPCPITFHFWAPQRQLPNKAWSMLDLTKTVSKSGLCSSV